MNGNEKLKCKDCPLLYDATTWEHKIKVYRCKAPIHFGGYSMNHRVSIKGECKQYPPYTYNDAKFIMGEI
jgi:hypothetical protein